MALVMLLMPVAVFAGDKKKNRRYTRLSAPNVMAAP